MNHLNFAITSLVDAQTGLNLSANLTNNVNATRTSRLNGESSKSVGGFLISTFKHIVSSVIRQNQERRNKMEFLNLTVRQLEDAGIELQEINQLRAGLINTDDLKGARINVARPSKLRPCATGRVAGSRKFAANQPDYNYLKLA